MKFRHRVHYPVSFSVFLLVFNVDAASYLKRKRYSIIFYIIYLYIDNFYYLCYNTT